jgi:hypothetical protein
MKNLHPRIKIIGLLTAACFGLSPQAQAVCQEDCLTNFNTVLGDDALVSLTTGTNNTAMGFEVLKDNTSGTANTATGNLALLLNTTGNSNTAIGTSAMLENTAGSENTAIGDGALFSNTTAIHNTATGKGALLSNTIGIQNTATGVSTLANNITGDFNTATGAFALYLSTGDGNTASGFRALDSNTNGQYNIALGFNAGANLTTGNYNIDIGHEGLAGESGVMRLGSERQQTATFIAGIVTSPLATGTAVAVGITADGQLGIRASSARFKEAIKPMDKASEAIFSLQPVTFRYKKALDPQALPQFGLVAEQVAKVDPDLVACDAEGKPFTVRYDEVNAMLLNEFIKAHRKVEALEATVTQLQAVFKAQAAQIQKVSDQLGVQSPAPRVAAND